MEVNNSMPPRRRALIRPPLDRRERSTLLPASDREPPNRGRNSGGDGQIPDTQPPKSVVRQKTPHSESINYKFLKAPPQIESRQTKNHSYRPWKFCKGHAFHFDTSFAEMICFQKVFKFCAEYRLGTIRSGHAQFQRVRRDAFDLKHKPWTTLALQPDPLRQLLKCETGLAQPDRVSLCDGTGRKTCSANARPQLLMAEPALRRNCRSITIESRISQILGNKRFIHVPRLELEVDFKSSQIRNRPQKDVKG